MIVPSTNSTKIIANPNENNINYIKANFNNTNNSSSGTAKTTNN